MSVRSAMPYEATPRFSPARTSVEAAWRLVDPILRNVTPVYEYEPNTWGPAEADRIISGDDDWHNPKHEEAIG